MKKQAVSMQQVLAGLQTEGLITADAAGKADAVLANIGDVQPWYIRTMVGFGAWLASLLLIGFVASIGIATDSGLAIIGAVLIAGAIFVRWQSSNDFMLQSALACSLAGQAILAYGIVELTGNYEFKGVLSVVIVLNVFLFFIFPDRIHRVLSVLIAATSLGTLLYIWEFNVIVPVLGPAFAAVLVFFYKRQGAFMHSGKGELVRPLISGVMLSSFGFLLLSSIYILPDLRIEFVFYPRPWISTVLLGALFLYVGTQVWPQLNADANASSTPIFYTLLVVIVAAAWAVPGLLLALIVIILGASSGNRVFVGAGIAFLSIFMSAYFYGIQLPMLTKSITLVATGVVVLLARWLILNVLTSPVEGGTGHV